MAHRIDTVEARARLKARTPPYWQKLSTGCHLGFRKPAGSTDGAWLAQAYDPGSSKQTRKSFGKLDHLPAHQRFDAAKKLAEAWFEHLGRGGSSKIITVKEACANYVQRLRETGSIKNAEEIEARFRRRVYSEKLAQQLLPRLTRRMFDEWRNRLADTPVLTNPHTDRRKSRPRSASSVNRDMAALRAALNSAHDHGEATNDMAWRVALRSVESEGGRREAYLDKKQRSLLIKKSDPDLALFIQCMSLIPLRPGALAALKAANMSLPLGVLTVGSDKAGRDRKIKLPEATAALFSEQTKSKHPAAPLLHRADGKPWNKDSWKKPFKKAVEAAELPQNVTVYTIRHSVITDLVTSGLDLLTVAQISGTSVAMIEKYYGHFRAEHAAQALERLKL